jgi:TPR repeat protein
MFHVFDVFFASSMSGSVLLHRQRSPEDLQQLLAWYKIRDTLFGENNVERDIKEALGLASVCEYPNAVWLTKLFDGRDVSSTEEARQVFLGCENDSRALCFAGILGWHEDEIRRAAELRDAFAQAWMAWETVGEESFRWAEKSSAQGERNGFYKLGQCYRRGIGCEEDAERAKDNFWLGTFTRWFVLSSYLKKDDAQRFVWLERAGRTGYCTPFLNEMVDQIRNFSRGTGRQRSFSQSGEL